MSGENNGVSSPDKVPANGAPVYKFGPGNKFGKGNPFGGKIEKFRARLIGKVTDEQFDRVVAALVKKAMDGEPWAIREFFDRIVGKSTERVQISGQVAFVEEVRATMAKIIASPRLRAAVEEEYRSNAG